MPQSKSRGRSITLYAAIGTHLSRMVTYLGDHTDTEGYQAFAQQLISELPPRAPYSRKPVLVCDNARPHYNKKALRMLSPHVNMCFMPPASCCFNSVETAFSKIKRAYKSYITKIALRRDYRREDAVACLNLACELVTPAEQQRLCRANRDYMNHFLPEDKQFKQNNAAFEPV